MAGAFITATLIGDKEFNAYLKKIVSKSGNARPAFEIAGQVLVTSIQENFTAQGRPDKWQRLSRATLIASTGRNSKTKKGKFRKKSIRKIKAKVNSILINRGMAGGLMGSIHANPTRNQVRVGSPKVYAAIHHFGGKAGRNNSVTIPERPFLLIQDQDWAEITDKFERFLIAK